MPKLSADEIITQRHKRNFIQFGGPAPDNPVKYGGQDTQYMSIQGVTLHDSGSIDPIYVPDPRQIGAFKAVNRSRNAPDLPEATLVLFEKHASLPWHLVKQNCPFTLYEATGACRDLSDFNNGWTDHIMVYSNALVTDKDLGDRSAWDSDDAIEDSLSLTLSSVYPIAALQFGAKADTTITAEMKDVVFGTSIRCGDCGVPNDGTRFIYAVQKGIASPATKPTVFYSVDGGVTWSSAAISSAANAEDIVALDIVGTYLVAASKTGGTASASCFHIAPINTATGVPSTSWVKVLPASFNATNTVNDMFVLSPSEIFFVCDGGYVYKSTDITGDVTAISQGDATVQNLARIDGQGDVLYAVGAGAAVIKSTNRGQTWAVTTTSPGAAANTAVDVLDAYRAWVGNASGALYYTKDGGETWTAKTFTAQTATAVKDIQFASDEVGVVAFTITGPVGYIASTINGGYSWVDSSVSTTTRLGLVPANTTINRVAWPTTGEPSIDVNTLAACGLGVTTDGKLIVGIANRI